MFRKDANGQFRKHPQINLGGEDLKQLMRLRNQIVVAAADFAKDEKLEPIVTAPLSRDFDEQLEHVQKAITIVDRSKKKIIATMKKYYREKPESSDVQIRLFTKKMRQKNFNKLFLLITNLMIFCNCLMSLLMYLNKLYLTRVSVTLCN